MKNGQIITNFCTLLTALMAALPFGCLSKKNATERALIIFIDDGRFQDLSCKGAITSHPRSGIGVLCQEGAVEMGFHHEYQNLNQALSDWLNPYQSKLAPLLYYKNWSTQLFPSGPEVITRGSIDLGFEAVHDTFLIRDGSWHFDAQELVQAIIQSESLFDLVHSKYQLLTLSDLTFHLAKKEAFKHLDLDQLRESSWELIDESIYQLLANLNFTSNKMLFKVIVLGISEDESVGSAIVFSNKDFLNGSITKSFSLEDLSLAFHSEMLPDHVSTLSQKNFSHYPFIDSNTDNLTWLVNKVRSEESLIELPENGVTNCLIQNNCANRDLYRKWILELKETNDYRRLSIIKSATEGFYLNELLGNPLKLQNKQKESALLMLQTLINSK